jgi:hypothetical protein
MVLYVHFYFFYFFLFYEQLDYDCHIVIIFLSRPATQFLWVYKFIPLGPNHQDPLRLVSTGEELILVFKG